VVLPPAPSRTEVETRAGAAETDVYPLPRRSPDTTRRPEVYSAVSDWVASFLFAILLIAALGLATYTLSRPFFAH
jgi:hypothetical protein